MSNQTSTLDDIYKDMQVYVPKFAYVDTIQDYECKGKCEKVESGAGTENWVIVGCIQCHYAEYQTCRAIGANGLKCRRKNALDRTGLCTRHQDYDKRTAD